MDKVIFAQGTYKQNACEYNFTIIEFIKKHQLRYLNFELRQQNKGIRLAGGLL
jgi:hypothetical protein